jgi:tight adherence protein C
MAQLTLHSDRPFGWVALVPATAVALVVARRRLKGRRTAKARLAAQLEAAPAAVDLLAACLTAGLNGHLALIRVAERCPVALKQEFAQVASDLRVGQSPAVALRAAAERTGLAELRAAAGALHAGERWGAPPAEALAARSEALRARLRLEAEAAAERAAVRLTFPLVFCFLPAFVLLTVVPMLAGAIRALGI